MKRSLTIAATVMLCCAPAVGSAADQMVTLIDLSSDAAAPKEIAHDIARAITRSSKLRYHSVNETLNTGGEDVHRTNLRSGGGLLKSALNRLKEGDYQDAAEELESAVTAYSQSFGHTTDHELIARCMTLHGVAQYLAKQRGAATKAWIRATEFRPKYTLDISKYGDAVEKAYNKARDKVLRRETVTFEVQTRPAHAEVWVNGRYFGLSPAFVKTLSGTQFVAVRKHGYARASSATKIDRGGQNVTLELGEARRKALFDTLRENLAEVFDGAVERNQLAQARGLLNAGMAVILRATGSREKMTIQVALANLDGRQIVKRITREMPWLRRDKVAMEELVAELFKAPEIPKGVDGPAIKHDTVFTKWWFWTGAAVVVGGSITAYLLLSGDDELGQKYQKGTGGIAIQF